MTGQLNDATFRREIAAQDSQSADWLDGLVQRVDHLLAWRLLGVGSFVGERAAGAGDLTAIHVAAVHQALGDNAPAAGLIDVAGDEVSAWLEADKDRRALVDGLSSGGATPTAPAGPQHALVNPTVAATPAIAFSNAPGVAACGHS
jgi:hypothetical protein